MKWGNGIIMQVTTRIAVVGAVALLGGCTALSGINPLAKKEDTLPGTRVAVLPQDVVSGSGIANPGAPLTFAGWTQPGGDISNDPGHVALVNPADRDWVARGAGSRRGVRAAAPPLAYGGRAYVYDPSGVVTAYAGNGGQVWRAGVLPEGEKGRVTGGGIAADNGTIYAATGFGQVVALDAGSGGQRWIYNLGKPARSAPTAAAGKVFVVDQDSVVHAIDQSSGRRSWAVPGISQSAGVLSASNPAVSGNTVVVPFSSGEVLALDTATGKLKWTDAVLRSSRTLAVSGLPDVAASPVIADGVVYATGVSGRTIAVRLSNGERLWEANIGSATTPVVSGDAVFMVDLRDNLVALNRSTGSVIYSKPLPSVRKKRFFSVWRGPTLAGGQLWLVSNNKRLLSANAATGEILSNVELPSTAYTKPIASAGQLLVLGGDGTLVAY